jgi:hypothetical protein
MVLFVIRQATKFETRLFRPTRDNLVYVVGHITRIQSHGDIISSAGGTYNFSMHIRYGILYETEHQALEFVLTDCQF